MSFPLTQMGSTSVSSPASSTVSNSVSSVPPARFSPGQLVSTPGALAAMTAACCLPLDLLQRHVCGDWGEIDAEDAACNEAALLSGERVLSAYRIGSETRIWLITEADRSVTTFLLPEEY